MAVATMPPVQAEPVQTKRLTYEEYLNEPEINAPYEIIDGELFLMPGPEWIHQRLVGNVYQLLVRFEKETKRGFALVSPFDVVVSRSPLRTRQPDVLFITNEQLNQAGGEPVGRPLERAPELVVEVLSPSETPRSLNGKLEDFRRVGVREVWLISSYAETVQVVRLTENAVETVAAYAYGQTVDSLSVPGLSVAVADIFAE